MINFIVHTVYVDINIGHIRFSIAVNYFGKRLEKKSMRKIEARQKLKSTGRNIDRMLGLR